MKIKKGDEGLFLLGEFQNRIDPRGRAFVPAKFRDQLGSPIYMVMDKYKCIECYNEEGIKAKYESVLARESEFLRSETMIMGLFSRGDTQPLDNQGRIIIKPDYLEAIGAEKDVVFLGKYDHFEIWSKDEYEKQKQSAVEKNDNISEIYSEEENVKILERDVEMLETRVELLRRKKAALAALEEI